MIAFYLDSFLDKDRKYLDDLNLAQTESRLEGLCKINYRAMYATQCEYSSEEGGWLASND